MMRCTTHNSCSRLAAIFSLLVFAIVCSSPSVHAANAVCKPNWEWSYNSKGQNPCEIAASLQGSCIGQDNFEVQPLSPGNIYANPKENTPVRKKCGCNTVIFSLYTACTLCQNSTSTWTWTGWSQFCDSVYVTQYPPGVPQNATVPHWAYLNYTTEGKFNPTFAESVGRDPETTATSSGTRPPPTATDSANEGGNQQSDKSGSASDAGAIAGGVIGGVALLVIIAAVVLFLRKRRRKARHAHVIDLALDEGAQFEATEVRNTHKTRRLYDPSDPSTFPTPLSVSGESYTPPQAYNTPQNHGKYTGSAEI